MVAMTVEGTELQHRGFQIAEVNQSRLAHISFLSTAKGTKYAVKVTAVRSPDEPSFNRDDAIRLKQERRVERHLMAPVGLLPVAERSVEGQQSTRPDQPLVGSEKRHERGSDLMAL